ncbi:MAG: response regulator transcription factor [Lachnospiraceae bacterium]|nr:response regulator transcription factor [Lachnospiraceae bacterium]
MKHKILIVDDEVMITELLSDHLGDEGYEIYTANSSNHALELLPKNPDLIILDINMPGMDGLELCKTIRAHVSCPILFVTARITEQDKINGLQYGGDDYITKPFSLKELSARVAAHLRRDERAKGGSVSVLTSGELLVNLSQHRVFYKNIEIEVSKKEFELIEFLLTNAGQVFDREHIYERIWGYNAEGSADVIKEHIRRIRTKLHAVTGEEYIETVWGVGYKWKR